jgi:hypothetical protein
MNGGQSSSALPTSSRLISARMISARMISGREPTFSRMIYGLRPKLSCGCSRDAEIRALLIYAPRWTDCLICARSSGGHRLSYVRPTSWMLP